MTTFELIGINTVHKRLADGTIRTYYYHRASGKRLKGRPGSAEFYDSYVEADRIVPHETDNVSFLIREYLKSPKFNTPDKKVRLRNRKGSLKPLRKSTQREYKRMLTTLEAEFGTMPIAALASRGAKGRFVEYQEDIGMDNPREADNRLTVLSAAFSYAELKGLIRTNPLSGFERMYESDRTDIVWLEGDISKFMDGASVEMQRALILALHTGQRYGDLVRLRWADYDGTYVSLKQGKTNRRVNVKVSAALRRMLDTTTKTCPYVLARPEGRPWFTEKNDKELGKQWRARMDAASLREDDYLAKDRNDPDLTGVRLHLNDLRGTSITLLGASGCSVPEIVSITGHTLESATRILEKYLSRTKAISDAAILKFESASATGFANRLQTAD